MPGTTPPIRVVVRLPYNRPENPLQDPPRVEWNSEKEQILWEVIAKSRAMEGAGTDWKGLAAHLQVPLPYLLYRAQTRYEEDLRGLQGIRGVLSPAITLPTSQIPTSAIAVPSGATSKAPTVTGEYFPKLLDGDKPGFARRNSIRASSGNLTSSVTGRPTNVRARLSSLGNTRLRTLSSMSRPAKKVSSSSTLTLQGPRRSRTEVRPLSPTSSHASSSPDASSEEDEDTKQEEEDRRKEETQALEQKLQELQRMMTKDALGLVSSPPRPSSSRDRGRMRPLSASSTSFSIRPNLDMTRRHSMSQTPSHHSLSSASSPQGSIPSIPSPPPEGRSHTQSPMTRHFSPPGKSTSPPAVSRGNAWGQSVRRGLAVKTNLGGGRVSERGSEMESEASSFSDFSDASLSPSALESSLISNMRGGGSRLSSFARSNLSGRRGGVH